MSFFEDDDSFSLETISFKPEEKFKSSLWLVLAGTNEIPPHIALIAEGKYYSLSARKVDCGSSLERLMNTITRKHIPTIFIHFETATIVETQNFASLQKIYKDLQPLGAIDNTCLSPIKEFFAGYYSDEFGKVNYVFELLALAKKKKLIKECVSLFCDDTNSNIVTLPKYSMAQIRNTIKDLHHQKLTYK